MSGLSTLVHAPLAIKGEAYNVTKEALTDTLRPSSGSQVHTSSQAQYITQWRRVLRSGGSNRSKSSRVHVLGDRLARQAKRLSPLLILGFRAGALRHLAGEFPLRHLARQVGGSRVRFLLVSSLRMMVQIIEHRVENSTDFLVEEEAASSTPQVPNRPVSGTTAVHAARQYTAAQTSRTPSRTAPGALPVARELLRHPPSSTASPGAMKQWRDDVDLLLGMAHSTLTRSRPRSSWRQHEASAFVRSPSVRGAQTSDLRVELNRRRAGEDARVSLERAHERRQNIEGRNLDQDFAAVAP
jgi:hypothetical protein